MTENFQPEFNLGPEGLPNEIDIKFFDQRPGESHEEYTERIFNAHRGIQQGKIKISQSSIIRDVNAELQREYYKKINVEKPEDLDEIR